MIVFKRNVLMIGLALSLFGAGISRAWAGDITVEATVSRRQVAVSEVLDLTLTIQGTQQANALELPDIDGFESRYLGPSTSISIINGQMSASVAHQYRLFPQKVGSFEIPALSLEIDGQTFTTEAISIEVTQTSQPAQTSQSQATQPAFSLEDKVFLVLEVDKQEIFVNEKLPVRVKLYISQLPVRDINLPVLKPEGFLADDMAQPQQYQEVINGISYQVVEFAWDIYPTRPGLLALGPAELVCNVLYQRQSRQRGSAFDGFGFFSDDFFGDFFGGYEKYPVSLSTEQVTLDVLPLPEPVPDHFSLAVGQFDFSVTADPLEVKVGDPITLRMQVSGQGNLKGVELPKLLESDDFRVYEPNAREEGGARTLEQVVIPKHALAREIPQMSFIYFDPKIKRYQTITRGPFALSVSESSAPSTFEVVDRALYDSGRVATEEFGRDIIFIKDLPGVFYEKANVLYQQAWLWILLISYTAGLVLWGWGFMEKKKILTDIAYAKRLKAPRQAKKGLKEAQQWISHNKPKEFFECVFGLLRDYLTHKFLIPEGSVTSQSVEPFLRDAKVNVSTIQGVQDILSQCDATRYGAVNVDVESMKQVFAELRTMIDAMERI